MRMSAVTAVIVCEGQAAPGVSEAQACSCWQHLLFGDAHPRFRKVGNQAQQVHHCWRGVQPHGDAQHTQAAAPDVPHDRRQARRRQEARCSCQQVDVLQAHKVSVLAVIQTTPFCSTAAVATGVALTHARYTSCFFDGSCSNSSDRKLRHSAVAKATPAQL